MLSLSGRIEAEDVTELERLLGKESANQSIAFDLHEITLVDRDAVPFLARCEDGGIELLNCPQFIREWMETERSGRSRARGDVSP